MEEENVLLKCPICFDVFHTTLLLPCSHNFCALCIRQSLTFGHKRCPICKKSCDTCDLRPNRLIDELVAHYLGSREIKQGLKGYKDETAGAKNSNKNTEQATSSCPTCRKNRDSSSSKAILDPPSSKVQSVNVDSTLTSPGVAASTPPTKTTITPSHSATEVEHTETNTKKRKRTEKVSDKSKKSKRTETRGKPKLSVAAMFSRSKAPEKVKCPVCKIPILKGQINTHLDQCLGTSIGREAFHEANQHLQWNLPDPPPTREKYKAYSHMTTDEIKSLLKNRNLPTRGDRKTMIKLHQEFVILQNASCDSLKPTPDRQVARNMALKMGRDKMKSMFAKKPKAPTAAKKDKLFSELLKNAKRRRKALRKKRKNEASDPQEEQVSSKQVIESYMPENRTVSNLPPYWEAEWNKKLGKVEYFNSATSLRTTDRDLVYNNDSLQDVATRT